MSERYLESLFGDEEARESARQDLYNHILPRFGQLCLDQVAESDILEWLESDELTKGTSTSPDRKRIKMVLARMWALAVDLNFVEPDVHLLKGSLRMRGRGHDEAIITAKEAEQLLLTARASANRQLKYVISLLMLTGARTGEILNLRWEHLDLAAGVWQVHVAGAETTRELRLTPAAVKLLNQLQRFDGCSYVVPNPATKKPYRSLTQSWDVVKSKAQLPQLELDDLRYCELGSAIWEDQLLAVLQDDDA
jgi:integrase